MFPLLEEEGQRSISWRMNPMSLHHQGNKATPPKIDSPGTACRGRVIAAALTSTLTTATTANLHICTAMESWTTQQQMPDIRNERGSNDRCNHSNHVITLATLALTTTKTPGGTSSTRRQLDRYKHIKLEKRQSPPSPSSPPAIPNRNPLAHSS